MRKATLSLLLCLATVAPPALARQGQPATSTAVPPPIAPPSDRLPRVRLVATGGTISNRTGGRLTADQLVDTVPGITGMAAVDTEQFSNLSSTQLTLDQWLALARRLNTLFREDPALAGIVVTSGTDTLEELAYFLHLTVRDRRPVVVTGSMRNPSQVGYEGPANLLASVRVAADPAAAGRGVLVVLNDEINGARDVTKTDAQRLQTFASRGFGALGVVDVASVIFRRTAEGRHTDASEFDVEAIDTLPRVDIFLVYQGATGDLIKSAIDLGARGVVIAMAGAGTLSGTQQQGLDYARQKQVPVVATTRAGSGRIAEPLEPCQKPLASCVAAGDLSAVKARVLLMLALTRSSSPEQLQRMFDQY